MTTKSVTNPFDGSHIADIKIQSAADVESALENGYRLFNDRNAWLPAFKRIAILEKTVEIMSQQVEELTLLAAREGGKPYVDSKVELSLIHI